MIKLLTMRKLLIIGAAALIVLGVIVPGIMILFCDECWDQGQEYNFVELVDQRSQHSKTYYDAEKDTYKVTSSLGSFHYQADPQDPDSPWLEIDTTITPSSVEGWDWEVTRNYWQLQIRNDATVAAINGDHRVEFKLKGIAYLDGSDYVILREVNQVAPDIKNNIARWDNIIDGVNLVLYARPDVLKEDVEVTQAFRDWFEQSGYDNPDALIAPIYECDWDNAGLPELSSGEIIDLNDWEGSEGIFFGDVANKEIINMLPMNFAYHENAASYEDNIIITTKFIDSNLLMGISVAEFNAAPEGTIVFDPTLNDSVDSSAADQMRAYSSTPYSKTHSLCLVGYANSSNHSYGCSMQFEHIFLASTATVSSATFTGYCRYDDTDTVVRSRISCQDEYAPSEIADQSDWDTRFADNTDAVVDWDDIPAWTAGVQYTSPNFATSVQEVVDDSGGSWGSLIVFWEDRENRTDASSGHYRRLASWDDTTYDPPEFDIVYTAGSGDTIDAITYDPTNLTDTTATFNGYMVTGGYDATATVYWGDNDGGTNPSSWDYSTAPTSPSQPMSQGAWYYNASGLTPGTPYFYTVKGVNIYGTDWGTTKSFTPGVKYWVGNSGSWSDTAHWASSSGGTGGAGVPASYDNVYFDANSFTAGSHGVTLTGTSNVCKTLTLTGSGSDTPTWVDNSGSGNLDLSVYGNITWESGWTFLDWDDPGTNSISIHANSTLTNCNWGDTEGYPTLVIETGTVTCATNTTCRDYIHNGGTLALGTTTFTTGDNFDSDGGTFTGTVVLSNGANDGLQQGYLYGAGSFNNLTFENSSDSSMVQLDSNITVTGTMTFSGTGTSDRLLVMSNNSVARTITAANVSSAYTDFAYITGAGAGDWDLSGAGEEAIEFGPCATTCSGITFAYPYSSSRDYYWVGGAGTWAPVSEWYYGYFAYSWSTVSGGSGGASRLPPPAAGNNVFFDSGSGFTAGNEWVSINADDSYNCKDMDWTGSGASSNPYVYVNCSANDSEVHIYGDLIFASDTHWEAQTDCSGDDVFLEGSGDVYMNGFEFDHEVGELVFSASGTYVFHDDLTFEADGSGAARWRYDSGTADFTTHSAVIYYTGDNLDGAQRAFYGGDQTYYELNDTSNSVLVVYGENTFTNFDRTGTHATFLDAVLFDDDQYMTNLDLHGQGELYRLHVGSTTKCVQRQISVSGTLDVTYCNIDSIAGVGVYWDLTAGNNSDLGCNLGITFTPGYYLYWVGNSGSWSDADNHWSATSGGAPGTARVPLVQDIAVFDEYSFTIPSRTVTIDMQNLPGIDAQYVANSPTFSKSGQVDIYGSTVLGTLTWNVSDTYFCGPDDTGFLSTAALNTDIYIQKDSYYMNTLYLGGNLTLNGDIYVSSGVFNLNGWDLTADKFDSSTTTYDRAIRMGSGTTTLDSTATGDKWKMVATNLDFYCEYSTIVLTNSGTNGQTFASGGLTYNNVIQQGAGVWTMTVTGAPTVYELRIDRSEASKTINGNVTITMQSFVLDVAGTNTITISSTDFSMAYGIVLGDYLIISNSAAGGGAAFFANVGGHSTDNGGNTGWIWGAPTNPTVQTLDPTNVTEMGATLNGELLTTGSYPSLLCYFEYGATIAYGWETSGDVLTAIGTFDETLTPYHTYHYRAVVEFGLNDHVYGNDKIINLDDDDGEAKCAVLDPSETSYTTLVDDDDLPEEPTNMYDEGSTDGIPFAPIIDPALDESDTPVEAFWYPLAFAIAIILGFLAYAKTRDLMVQCFVSGAVMVAFCGGGVLGTGLLPFATVLVFAIEAFCILIIQQKQYT